MLGVCALLLLSVSAFLAWRLMPGREQLQQRLILILCGIFVAGIAFAGYAAQIINLFYEHGAYFRDAGWHAYLFSRFEWAPLNPPLMVRSGSSPYFFSTHFSPMLPLWGALAEAARWPPSVAYAVFQGAIHALLAGVGIALGKNEFLQPWNTLFRICFGATLAFGPIALAAIAYPHYELAIPILFLTTVLALSHNNVLVASMAFALMLTVREDAGFHGACFLLAYALAERIRRKRWSRSIIVATIFAAAALTYSCIAFLGINILSPNYRTFSASYAGSGFDHLSLLFYQDRSWGLVQKRPELILIIVLTCFLAVAKKDLTLAAGAIAIAPWLVLNLSAVAPPPGELFTYYAFPFLIVFAWPWVVAGLRCLDSMEFCAPVSKSTALLWMIAYVVCLAAFFTVPLAEPGYAHLRYYHLPNFIPQITRGSIHNVSASVDALKVLQGRKQPRLLLDYGLISLMAAKADLENSFDGNKGNSSESYVVAYFRSYMQTPDIEQSEFAKKAERCFEVDGTNIRLITKGAVNAVNSAFGRSISARECNQMLRN